MYMYIARDVFQLHLAKGGKVVYIHGAVLVGKVTHAQTLYML